MTNTLSPEQAPPRSAPKNSLKMQFTRHWRYGAWAASLVIVVALWQLVLEVTGGAGLIFAGPFETFEQLIIMASDGTLLNDFLFTAQEFLISFAIAGVVGVSLGILVGYFKPVKIVLSPWLAAGYATPLIALTPLFIVWFGIGIWSKVAVGVIVMVFPILINTSLGVSTSDSRLIEMVRSLGGSQRQIITKVILRGSVPHITTGFKLAVGRGFTAIVAAELLGSRAGMGYRILTASQTFQIEVILAYVVVLAIVGASLLNGLEVLGRRIDRHGN